MLSILDQQMISEYNVFKELIQSYNKQIVMEEYIQEDGEKKSILSGIKAGSEKLGKGLLNLLKKGWELFNKFLNKLKGVFEKIKSKFNKPWFDEQGYKIKIEDKRVLDLVKYKFPNLIFNDEGLFIQTTGARLLDESYKTLTKIHGFVFSDKYENTISKFSKEIDDSNHEKLISDEVIDNLDNLTRSNRLINDDLNKILKDIQNTSKVNEKNINMSRPNSLFGSVSNLILILINRYELAETFFNRTIDYFDDRYKEYPDMNKDLQKNYNKALQSAVNNLGTIVDNIKLLFELSTEYNIDELGNFKTFLNNSDTKEFKQDYKDYRSEKTKERNEKIKEDLNNKLDGMKSKFKRNKKENKEEENNDDNK